MARSSKGSDFERWVCKRLSLWWSDDERDDLFWRTSTSGARATVRRRKGKTTAGHCGDICSTDPSSAPFTSLFAVEVKRGYNKVSFADMLDRPYRLKLSQFHEWVLQAEEAQRNSGAWSWLLITRRDAFLPLVFMPHDTSARLHQTTLLEFPTPHVSGSFFCEDIVGMQLEGFLDAVTPERLIDFARSWRLVDAQG